METTQYTYCRVDEGLPKKIDGISIHLERSRNMTERLDEVVGYTTFSKNKRKKIAEVSISSESKQKTYDVFAIKEKEQKKIRKKKKDKKTYGYIKTEEGSYIACRNRETWGIWLLLLFLLLLLIGVFLYERHNNPLDSLGNPSKPIIDERAREIEEGETETEEQLDSEMTEIPGYYEFFVNEEHAILDLVNPIGNTVYFQYIICENGVPLYETDSIPPGTEVPWNVLESLQAGDHSLTFQINTYDISTYESCISPILDVTIHVIE